MNEKYQRLLAERAALPGLSPETEAAKLRRAATHEAAHAIILQVLLPGASASIDLKRCSDDCGAVWFAGTVLYDEPKDASVRKMVSLAGGVAEALFADGHMNDRGDQLWNAIVRRISPRDAKNSGGFDRGDIDATIRVVLANRTLIEERAAHEAAIFANPALRKRFAEDVGETAATPRVRYMGPRV